MSEPRRLLLYTPHSSASHDELVSLKSCQLDIARNVPEVLERLSSGDYSGVCLVDHPAQEVGFLLESGGMLENFPDAVVLLSLDLKILWCNQRLYQQTGRDSSLTGSSFYDAFGTPEILGPDFCPFHTAIGSGEAARSTIRVDDKTYYEVYANPILEGDDGCDLPSYLLVTVRDVSEEMAQRNKLTAIYQAGLELGDLQPQDVLEMSTAERIELLKSKILHYTEDLLEFDTVEIRLLDLETNRLEPLLAVGMEPVAAGRELYASAEGNGVTGFVAATGNSYLCEDTTTDPLYLQGAPDARSSLTVPLILHDQTLGTFNVESPRPGAFSNNDLEFLELFGREVAVALNTLELLVAEKMTTANESTTKILSEVAPSVDQILNDASWIMEKYIGYDAPVSQRLSRILEHTRNIRRQIQEVGQEMAPQLRSVTLSGRDEHQDLRGKHLLVADSESEVRIAAHELLGRYGCLVETAHDGEEALLMIRSTHYDAVLADIRLPDMNGGEFFQRVREIHEHLPVILMTGYGYDATHSIVKARELGLESVLFKPFRLDQLVTEVQKAVCPAISIANQ